MRRRAIAAATIFAAAVALCAPKAVPQSVRFPLEERTQEVRRDVDGDSLDDIVRIRRGDPVRIELETADGEGGYDESRLIGILPEDFSGGIDIRDYDNDGDEDIVITSENAPLTFAAFQNDGDVFKDHVVEPGITPWKGDLTGDGVDDFFARVATYWGTGLVFKRGPLDRFLDITTTTPVYAVPKDRAITFAPYDADGDGVYDITVNPDMRPQNPMRRYPPFILSYDVERGRFIVEEDIPHPRTSG